MPRTSPPTTTAQAPCGGGRPVFQTRCSIAQSHEGELETNMVLGSARTRGAAHSLHTAAWPCSLDAPSWIWISSFTDRWTPDSGHQGPDSPLLSGHGGGRLIRDTFSTPKCQVRRTTPKPPLGSWAGHIRARRSEPHSGPPPPPPRQVCTRHHPEPLPDVPRPAPTTPPACSPPGRL